MQGRENRAGVEMTEPSNDGVIAMPVLPRGHADFPLTDMQRLLVVSASDGMEYALLPHLYFEVERPVSTSIVSSASRSRA